MAGGKVFFLSYLQMCAKKKTDIKLACGNQMGY